MNRFKPITFVAVLRFAFPLCAMLFLVHTGWGDDPPELKIDDTGLLTIGDGETMTEVILNAELIEDLTLDHELGLLGILIEAESVLEIEAGTMVHLGGSYISVKGTLIVPSTLGTGIYSGKKWWDTDEELDEDFVPARTNLHIDGGTVQITKGVDSVLWADTINVAVASGGGTLDVAAGVTFESGTISGGNTGDVTILGGGTYRVGDVSMGGAFNVEAGVIHFLGNAVVGKLNSESGTLISGLHDLEVCEDEDELELHDHDHGSGKANLSILKGGKIQGVLEDIGNLLVGDGTSSGTLTFAGGQFHTIERIGIARNATLDLQDGTLIRLTSENAEEKFDDVIIEGTLRVSSATGTGIYKGDDLLNPDATYLIVAGSTNNVGEVTGGIVEIYKSDPESEEPETLIADTLHTQVIGIGKIVIESGVTFESGRIEFGTGGQSNVTGAHVIVSGGGTYQTAEIDLGKGYLMVEEAGTTMEVFGDVTAGSLISGKGTTVITGGDAQFTSVDIAGIYDGTGKNLTIQQGGWVAGQISNVDTFTLTDNSSLYLVVSDLEPDTPIISVGTWAIEKPNGTRIQVVGGSHGASYKSIIEVMDGETDDLLNVLQKSGTALYNPTWSVGEDGTSLDLNLRLYSVGGYIGNEWRMYGQNIASAGRLLDQVAERYPEFRMRLEGLNDAQLRSAVRSIMAGELVGNAFRFAMQQPSNTVFRHLDNVTPLRSPFARGQVREGYNVWFNAFGQSEHARSDGGTFDGYDMTRYGFHVGSDIEIYNRTVVGAFFGYSSPYVKSNLGRIASNNYTAGAYLRMPTAYEVVLNAMVGFGGQDYSYRSTTGSANYDGSSLFASIELARPIKIPHYQLTPLVAVDFQSASVDNFIVRDPILGGIIVKPENADSTAIRVGLMGETWRFRSRIQYMRQIAGKDCVSSSTSILGDELMASVPVRGTQWGEDWLNAGIGYEIWATRHWRFVADYNFDMGKRTTSHLGALNTVLKW